MKKFKWWAVHIALFLIASIPINFAFAGWFADFCERHLIIADDPYQFEHLSTDSLVKTYRHYGATIFWNKAKDSEIPRLLKTLGDELRRRPQSDEVIEVLNNYSQYEWKILR